MTFISTRDLSGLPEIDSLKRLMQSLATLDLILSLGDGACHTFQSRWGRDKQMGAIDNGSGDDLFVHFDRHGCILIGFDHECEMTPYREDPPRLWSGLLDEVPREFSSALKEPAFDIDSSTFVIWRLAQDESWSTGSVDFPDGDDPDGSELMLSILDGSPATFVEWAEEYYEIDVDLQIVSEVYDQEPLTAAMIESLNPEAEMGRLHNGLVQIGYPGF